MNASSQSRRRFLRNAAALAAASTLPRWIAEECAAQPVPASPGSVLDQPGIAAIGFGNRGKVVLRDAARFGRVVALCEVDATRLEQAKALYPDAATFSDYRRVLERKDVEVVICGTVDHWHTQISAAAMKAGKDVYCEKPLTLTVAEGRHLVKVARETGRILQTGSQQRSDNNFRLAAEIVRNGRLGKLQQVAVWLPTGRREGPFATAPVPAELDWNQWQGQTPAVDYVKERAHQTFRYWWEYSGGTMTDWGAHHHDIVLWALGQDRSGPVEIEGKSLVEMIPGGFSAASEYEVKYTYADGLVQHTRSTPDDAWNGSVVNANGQRNGIRFEGANGWLWVRRGEIATSDPDLLAAPFPASAERLYASQDHIGNFFECVRTRHAPICDVEIGHRSASVCHLGVIALRLGRKLQWNPAEEKFTGDPAADAMLQREMRAPFTLDYA